MHCEISNDKRCKSPYQETDDAWIHYYYTVLVNQFEGLIKIGRKVNHRLVTGTNRLIVRATVTGAPTPSQKRHYTEISWTWGWGRRVARSMKRAR